VNWGEKDVGKYATRREEVFRIVGYQPNPTLTFENVKTGKQEDHAINCLNIEEFVKLKAEKKIE
jgi:hypothetical protein